jgi:hypothetical protein
MLITLPGCWERRNLGVIILTEAAKRGFRTLRPDDRLEGAALRLDRDRPSVDKEFELAVYLEEPEEGDDHVEH